MIINDLDGYYIVFDTKNWNTELDTLLICTKQSIITNGVIIPVESNVLKETSRISVLINGKEYIGIL